METMSAGPAEVAPGRWLDKQVSMVAYCSVSNSVGQIACVSAVYWYWQAFAYHHLWWMLGMANALLILVVPNTLFRVRSGRFRQMGVLAHSVLGSVIPALWLYTSLVAYPTGSPNERAVYATVLAGMSAAGVTTIPNNPRLASAIVLGFLLPFMVASFRLSSDYGNTMGVLVLIYAAVLINQVLAVQNSQRTEFLLSERNRALLEENERNAHNLVQASRMAALGQMAGGVAHEINNPLAILSLEVEEIRENLSQPTPNQRELSESLDQLQSTTERISRIVGGMLAISRDESSKISPVHARELYDDLLSVCAEKVRVRGIRLSHNRDTDCFPDAIECNRVQVGQVLLNLVNNAVDALLEAKSEAPWIDIRIVGANDNILIQVKDSGPGLDAAIVDRIFEPFFTTKPVGSGTGLGLSISRGLIEAQGGLLRLCPGSEHTCFEIVFPRPSTLS